MKLATSATVVITIEVSSIGSYGVDWKLNDLHDQVAKEAVAHVLNQLPGVRIIGNPKVKACTFEIEKS